MTNPEITKANTVESFMKANSTLRIGKDAVTDFLTRLGFREQWNRKLG